MVSSAAQQRGTLIYHQAQDLDPADTQRRLREVFTVLVHIALEARARKAHVDAPPVGLRVDASS